MNNESKKQRAGKFYDNPKLDVVIAAVAGASIIGLLLYSEIKDNAYVKTRDPITRKVETVEPVKKLESNLELKKEKVEKSVILSKKPFYPPFSLGSDYIFPETREGAVVAKNFPNYWWVACGSGKLNITIKDYGKDGILGKKDKIYIRQRVGKKVTAWMSYPTGQADLDGRTRKMFYKTTQKARKHLWKLYHDEIKKSTPPEIYLKEFRKF